MGGSSFCILQDESWRPAGRLDRCTTTELRPLNQAAALSHRTAVEERAGCQGMAVTFYLRRETGPTDLRLAACIGEISVEGLALRPRNFGEGLLRALGAMWACARENDGV